MIRKPNKSINDYTEKRKIEIKNTKSVTKKARLRNEIKNYRKKWNNYKKFKSYTEKVKERNKLDWERTKIKLKGKTKKQKLRLKQNYIKRKQKRNYKKSVRNNPKFFKDFSKKDSFVKIEKVLINKLNTKDDLRGIIVTLSFKNSAGQITHLSDYVTKLSLKNFKENTDNENFINDFIERLSNKYNARKQIESGNYNISFQYIYTDNKFNKISFNN